MLEIVNLGRMVLRSPKEPVSLVEFFYSYGMTDTQNSLK